MLNQIKAVKELLTRSLGLDIPLRQPKQILKHFKNDKLNIKKLKHLGLWWFELCLCLMKKGFSHFPSWTVCICMYVCVQVFLLSQCKCLYLYLCVFRFFQCLSWSAEEKRSLSVFGTNPPQVSMLVLTNTRGKIKDKITLSYLFISYLCSWHKPTPGDHAGPSKNKRYYTL